jgi:Flp pilus assembly protein TadG
LANNLELRRTRRGQRGQTVVEFALAGTVLLSLMFAVIDFGRALFTYNVVTNAARIGSRYAIVHGSSCTLAICPASSSAIQTYVLSKVSGLNPSQLTVTARWTTGSGCGDPMFQGPNCIVTVTATYPFKLVMSLNRSWTMTATSQMVISQ